MKYLTLAVALGIFLSIAAFVVFRMTNTTTVAMPAKCSFNPGDNGDDKSYNYKCSPDEWDDTAPDIQFSCSDNFTAWFGEPSQLAEGRDVVPVQYQFDDGETLESEMIYIPEHRTAFTRSKDSAAEIFRMFERANRLHFKIAGEATLEFDSKPDLD